MHTQQALCMRKVGYYMYRVMEFLYFIMEKLWNSKVQKVYNPRPRRNKQEAYFQNFSSFQFYVFTSYEYVFVICYMIDNLGWIDYCVQ